jgi:hypothetical protein
MQANRIQLDLTIAATTESGARWPPARSSSRMPENAFDSQRLLLMVARTFGKEMPSFEGAARVPPRPGDRAAVPPASRNRQGRLANRVQLANAIDARRRDLPFLLRRLGQVAERSAGNLRCALPSIVRPRARRRLLPKPKHGDSLAIYLFDHWKSGDGLPRIIRDRAGADLFGQFPLQRHSGPSIPAGDINRPAGIGSKSPNSHVPSVLAGLLVRRERGVIFGLAIEKGETGQNTGKLVYRRRPSGNWRVNLLPNLQLCRTLHGVLCM